MKKKLFVSAILLAIFSFCSITFSFAANNGVNNAVNGIRNFVGGTENVIEDAGKGAANGIKDGMNTIGNGTKDITNGVENGMRDNRNNNGGYTATRTNADTGAAGMFGISNVGTWVVLAIVGIVIVALVMYYAKQNNVITYNHNDNDDE